MLHIEVSKGYSPKDNPEKNSISLLKRNLRFPSCPIKCDDLVKSQNSMAK